MKKIRCSIKIPKSSLGIVAALMLLSAFGSVSIPAHAQRGGHGGGGHAPGGGGGGRSSGGGGGVVHARREVVNTRQPAASPRYVAPPSIRAAPARVTSSPGFTGQRPAAVVTGRSGSRETSQGVAQRAFTKTALGRHYDNGLQLRKGVPVSAAWQHGYFPNGRFHYPFYAPSFGASVFISPFGFYFGVCAPFILRSHCYVYPPAEFFIDIPIYSGDTCQGYAPIDARDNYLDLDALADREPGLANAVNELREAFGRGDVDALVALTDPKVRIAIFERGKYKYSMDPNDFVDMSRDAFLSTQTVAFDITEIHERAAGVYVASGQHVYQDHNGHSRTVYVSYVLEDTGGNWTLTQVGTAPDKIQKWQ